MDQVIHKLIEVHSKLKAEKPRIHMIPNEVSASFCADMIAAVGAKPIMAIEPKEVAAITEYAKCLVVNMGQLTDKKYLAIKESLQVAYTKGIPVVFDPVGVGASSYRLKHANLILQMPWQGILKLNKSEYETLVGQKLTHSGVDSNENTTLISYNDLIKFGHKRSCLLTGEKDWIGENRWEIVVKHSPNRLPKIVGSGCALGALSGAIRAVEANSILASTLASLMMSGAASYAEERACGYMDYKMYLIDKIFNLTEDELREYGKLFIERRMG